LKQLLEFKIIKNDLKSPHSVGPKSSRGYSARPGGLPCAVGQKAGWATAWRPGPAAEAACALRRGHRARDGVVKHLPVARWQLAGGKVLGSSTTAKRQMRRARRAETGLTGVVAR
jgi:hypothetical protein